MDFVVVICFLLSPTPVNFCLLMTSVYLPMKLHTQKKYDDCLLCAYLICTADQLTLHYLCLERMKTGSCPEVN